MSDCPVCGSEDYREFSDPERIEPNEEWCDVCGFHFHAGLHIAPTRKIINECRRKIKQDYKTLVQLVTQIERMEWEEKHG